MRRYLGAMGVAYALGVTLLAARWWVQVWSFRQIHADLSRRRNGPAAVPTLRSIHLDFGVPFRTPGEQLAVFLGDVGDGPFLGAVAVIVLGSLVAAFLAGRSNPDDPPRSLGPVRWARRGSVASLALGAASFALIGGLLRGQALHPNPWPGVALFVATTVATVVGLGCGAWGVVRGPRRVRAAAWGLAGLIPCVLWGGIGLYARAMWDQRLVPNNPAMNLAKMAGAMGIRLEASVAYPHRVETDRLVMRYDRLDDPRSDAEAMDRHLARLEAMLGRPLRGKVDWVRGRLPRLGLGHLSLHGIALGSDASPADKETGGTLDRHELAHAALDQYRRPEADPPFLLHEGWAESQSGVGPVVLARRALEQRAANPPSRLKDLLTPDWYHRDDGPVYPLGGAFVDFLIRTFGAESFLKFYNACSPDAYDSACRDIYGADLDALDARFWDDARRQADSPN